MEERRLQLKCPFSSVTSLLFWTVCRGTFSIGFIRGLFFQFWQELTGVDLISTATLDFQCVKLCCQKYWSINMFWYLKKQTNKNGLIWLLYIIDTGSRWRANTHRTKCFERYVLCGCIRNRLLLELRLDLNYTQFPTMILTPIEHLQLLAFKNSTKNQYFY